MRRALLLLAALLPVLAACTSDGPGADEAHLVPEGVVQVAQPGGPWQTVGSPRRLSVGDRVRVRRGGAVLELAGGGRLELREESAVEVGARPVLLAGDLLVEASDRTIVVDADGTFVRLAGGSARLSRSLAFTVAAYTAALDLEGEGRSLEVPALRQAVVPAAGFLPNRPSPLRYDEADEWDRRFLGEAIDLGRELEAKSLGFTSQLREGEGATVEFFRSVLPLLTAEPAFGPELLQPGRPAGETLVGAVIAMQAEGRTFTRRWEAVFEFREAGAEWGLVALDHGVERDPLVAEVDAAIGRSAPQLVFAAPTTVVLPGTAPQPTTPPSTATRPPPPSPTTTTSGAAAPPPTTSTTTTTLVPSTPTIPISPAPSTVPVDPITGLVDELLGGLVAAVAIGGVRRGRR
jgi:hypothetical protein